MVDTSDKSRSRVGSETPVEDLTIEQYTVEVCVLEVHSEKDVVHSLLTVNKEEVVERDSGHCPTTFDNSIEIDISDKSKSRFQEDMTGDLKKGAARLHRPVLTIMQEGANQTIKPRTGYDHRNFDNTDASQS